MTIQCTIKNQPSISHHAPKQKHQNPLLLDDLVSPRQSHIPPQFIWPDNEKPSLNPMELHAPVVDIGSFLAAAELIGQACRKHGFFLVVNHGVDEGLIADVHRFMNDFFEQSFEEKIRLKGSLESTVAILAASLGDSHPSCHGRKLFPLSTLMRRALLIMLKATLAALWVRILHIWGMDTYDIWFCL